MKRWALLALVLIVIGASLLVLRQRLMAPSPKSKATYVALTHLARTPKSAYKYDLCVEAFAYAHALPNNPYKTNFTFQDPFRNVDDTIIPILMGLDQRVHTVSFNVTIIINQVATFKETISHISVLDGISVILPDKHNQLQRSGQPQFIVSSLLNSGNLAILDYTCAEEWHWTATTSPS